MSISDLGGKATITISQSVLSQTATAVQLNFSGTGLNAADTNAPPNSLNGPNYEVTDANGKELDSGDFVFIDRGTLSTTITVTGLNNFVIGPNYTLVITLGEVDQAQPSATANIDTVTIINTNTQPAATLNLSQKTFTAGGQTTVTASLAQTTNAPVTVFLSFTGTATPNIDYSVTEGLNQPNPGQATDVIVIPAGQTSGSVILTGLNDNLNRAETTVTVGIASVTGAMIAGSPTVTANYVNPNVPVSFTIQDTVTVAGWRRGRAGIPLPIAPLPGERELHDRGRHGERRSGIRITQRQHDRHPGVRAGSTVQTLDIDTIPLGAGVNLGVASTNFSVTLSGASLDVPVTAAPSGVGVTIANGTATVSILETSVVNGNTVAVTLQQPNGNSPPDIAAAVGTPTPPNGTTPLIDARIVVMTNDQYTVYDYSTGFTITQTSLDAFWIAAGLSATSLTGDVLDSRVVFDPALQRFFAVAINPVGATNNNILLAVSKTQDPLGGWSAFTLPVDPVAKANTATAVALGLDGNAVYIAADTLNPLTGATGETAFSIPKMDFNNGAAATTNFTQYFNIPSGTELQPEVDLSRAQPENLLSGDATTPNDLLKFIIAGVQNPNAAISSPTDIPVSTITNPPNAQQEGTATTISTGLAGFSGNTVQVGNDLWAVETVADPTSGLSDIRWYELNATTGAIEQTNLISSPTVSYYNASVAAANSVTGSGGDQVVIGFTGSNKNQFASAYSVIGETVGAGASQTTTFTAPVLLTPGAGSYNVPVNGANAWGNYSATVYDPNIEPFGSSAAATGVITGASNASPIVITTNSTALLATGLTVTISGVGGNTAANGTFTITVLNATTFQLNGSMGNGTYTSGGHWALAARAATFWTFQEFASAPNVWSVEMAEITVALPQATLPTVGLSISSSQLGEDYGTVTIAASLTGGVPSSDDIEVNLLFGGSATENGQYSASGQTIFIPAGSLSGSIILTGLPVNTLGTPTVTVSINQASLFNATPGSPSSVSATIEDTDPVAAGNISGEVYNDLNFSGTLQAGDPGLGNVLVFLDKNSNGTFDVATDPYIFTTAAGATQGDYTFFGLANGAYNVYQVSPSSFSQTQPAPGTGYLGVSPPASGINFGDAQITNPNASVSINIPQITDDKSSGTLTVKLAQGTAVPVSVTILVGGLAPFTDYTLTGPSGTVTLTAASDTFVATIPAGKTSVAYTITANSDSTNTNETITFRVVNVANATLTGSSQVETSIVTASGSPASSSTARRNFPARV